MNFEEDFDEIEELEELTDDLVELSEDDEEDVDGGRIYVYTPASYFYKNITGSTRGQRTSECIQSFTINCGKVKSINLKSQSRPGMGFTKKGNYLYAVRRNPTIKGTIKGTVYGSIHTANVTWTFK